MKKHGIVLTTVLLLAGNSVLADELMKERKDKARENVLEQERAREAIDEDQKEEARENVNPYERIDPKSKKNLFEEMESDKNPSTQNNTH